MLNEACRQRFCKARRAAIARDFNRLNPEQREGVLATEGPLLLLAGAGSGKTTVLIQRVVNLIRYGCGSDSSFVPPEVTEDDLTFLEHYAETGEGDPERQRKLCALHPAPPWSILAITFTNKAAGELKDRLESALGPESRDVWAFTFHAACVRILRRNAERLGFPSSFTIYDTDDSLRVIRNALKELDLNEKLNPPRKILAAISKAKRKGQLAQDFREKTASNPYYHHEADIYDIYQRTLWDAGALDFDDLILHTVRLLRDFEDVREYYQHRFHYVLVDEYQDTNTLQYELTALLSGGRNNLCVVGDDDQSIYRFRGATIKNILSFEKQYPDTRVIRLERNYRSTGNILDAANAVISNNHTRTGKKLWTSSERGDLIQVCNASDEKDEASFVAEQIVESHRAGRAWKDHAILYRMNAQSNQMEVACKRFSIPYRIIGGTRFFDRAEVKDMLSYLTVLRNPDDNLRLERIINNPPRGIGPKTVEQVQALARQEGVSLYTILCQVRNYPELERSAAKLTLFLDLLRDLRELLKTLPLDRFYEQLLERSGYAPMLQARGTQEDEGRLANAKELQSSIRSYLEETGSTATGAEDLAGFLDHIALYTDLDSHDPNQDCAVMMTVHAAKGLEFPVVFVTGLEDHLFPDGRAIGEEESMEEERRLCYVAMTRAKEKLYLTCARNRMLFGYTNTNDRSRFLKEVPQELISLCRDSTVPDDEDRDDDPDDGFFPSRSGRSASRSGGSGRYGGYGGRSSAGTRSGYSPGSSRGAFSRARSSGSGEKKAKAAAAAPSFRPGDVVRHTSFGQGTVLSINPMGPDCVLEIAFEKSGTKKLMFTSARKYLTKL